MLGRLGVIRETSDPTRDVQTVAQLVETRDVAQRVIEQFEPQPEPGSLLGDVEAVPVAQTNIVAVTAQAAEPARAAEIANTFGEQAVAERTEQFHRQIDLQLPDLGGEAALAGKDERQGERELRKKIGELERALGRKTYELEVLGNGFRTWE